MGTTSVRIRDCALYYIPLTTRIPLRFGRVTVTELECLRVRMTVEAHGQTYDGWGEAPLNISWAWPEQHAFVSGAPPLRALCARIGAAWRSVESYGHALELGYVFLETHLPRIWRETRTSEMPGLPWLAALLCSAPFDLALHDAFGRAVDRPIYETYSGDYLGTDLAGFYASDSRPDTRFKDRYPRDYYPYPAPTRIPVWHLVGCADAIEPTGQKSGSFCPECDNGDGRHPRSAESGHPSSLREWITHDRLRRLKVKLCGASHRWDYERLAGVGSLATELGVEALSVDFNGTAPDADYVTSMFDRLKSEEPRSYGLLRYVEQPFAPHVSVSAHELGRITSRLPVLLDEGATTWRDVRDSFELGYSGVALKTCKTQSAAILSLCWAREHGMGVVVQDLTNPMLAQISHAQLGAHGSPEIGIESNAMQFYPEASEYEARVHPGLYRRRNGMLDLSTITGPGFGYRLEEMERSLPERAA